MHKLPPGETTTFILLITRKILCGHPAYAGPGVKGCQTRVGLLRALDEQRSGTVGQEKENGRRMGKVWTARAERRAWCPGSGQAKVLVLTTFAWFNPVL